MLSTGKKSLDLVTKQKRRKFLFVSLFFLLYTINIKCVCVCTWKKMREIIFMICYHRQLVAYSVECFETFFLSRKGGISEKSELKIEI